LSIDTNEFRSIFDQYYEMIRNFLYYKTGDIKVAEDIAQDAFLKLWEKREEIQQNTIKNLLYTISGNLAINHLKHQTIVYDFARRTVMHPSSESPQYVMEEKEFKEKLERVISGLPENNRIVFLMNRIDRLTYNEIAERLGLSVKAVEKRMKKALDALVENLGFKL
jgi:RNA polymerase sigma-70 factor (family 1)